MSPHETLSKGMVGSGAGQPEHKESRISEALGRLDNESGNLMDIAKGLLAVLEPVMAPQEPEDKGGQNEIQVGSDVVTRIDVVTERLLAIRFRLENGSRRLEI